MSASVMPSQNRFARAPQANVQRSKFDRSHGLKTTGNFDVLIPIYVDEVLPGDTFNLKANIFGRLATPINPVMDNMYLDTFYFFVPMRLVWANTQKFFGEQVDPGDSIAYTIPTKVGHTVTAGMLPDYMGIPPGS